MSSGYIRKPQTQPRGMPAPRVFKQTSSSAKVVKASKIDEITVAQVVSSDKKKKAKRKYVSLSDPSAWPEIRSGSSSRDIDVDKYRRFIIKLMTERCNIKQSEAERYTDESAMTLFVRAMSHDSVNPTQRWDNYEMMEHMGDVTVNKCTSWYLKNRFPDIIKKGDEGVQIISKQEALLKSKIYLAKYSEMLGLQEFIRYRPLEFEYSQVGDNGERISGTKRVVMDRSMKEDVFEAFFCCLEEVIDTKEGMVGVGYSVCFKLMSGIYDTQYIPTTLYELVDAKTQLKEVFDIRQPRYNRARTELETPGDTLEYEHDIERREARLVLYLAREKGPIIIGPVSTAISGEDSDYETSKKIVDQRLARDALDYLHRTYGEDYRLSRYAPPSDSN